MRLLKSQKPAAAVTPPDLSQYATLEKLTKKAEILPVYDPLPSPQPLSQQPTIANLPSVVANVVGTQMVDAGKIRSFGRTSDPLIKIVWENTFNVSPAVTPCKLRFAVASAKISSSGGVEVSINGATPLTASNTGLGWSAATPALSVFTDGSWTWFECAIPAQSVAIPVRVQLPTGQGAAPVLYPSDAITSLKPANPTGWRLISFPGGEEFIFRPNQFAAKTDIPAPFNPTTLTNRILELENRPTVGPVGVVAFSTEPNLTTQLNSTHPSGGLYKEFVTEWEGNAIDLTIGTNTNAATLKSQIGIPAIDPNTGQPTVVIRTKSGIDDAIVPSASLIPNGLYRVWYSGGQLRIRVLDSAG